MSEHDSPEMLPFDIREQTLAVEGLELRLCMIPDLDAVLDHYAVASPSDDDMIPYYTRLWESAFGLATYMARNPNEFRGRQTLELGCGLGLPSLVAAKLGARVVATDYHPDNGPFFLHNAELNGLDSVTYQEMDWRKPDLHKPFDVILGSDLIYERRMVIPLADCADKLCRPGGLFLLADPGRPALQETSDQLEHRGFVCNPEIVEDVFVLIARKPPIV